MSDKSELIAKFCNISGVSSEEAEHLLEAFEWNYAEAVRAHFDTDEEDSPRPSVVPPVETSQSNVGPGPNDASKREQKIITFDTLRNSSPEGPEEGQAFYVGGSETGGGGQQVLGPPRRNPNEGLPDPNSAPDEFVHRLFQAARGQGAEVLDTERYKERSERKKVHVPFSGTGYKLGEDPSAPSVVAQGPGSSDSIDTRDKTDQNEERSVVVKMWRDGFSLDDGPLRAYTDPASRSFLEDIQSGTVPQELVRSACGGLVNLLLEDHHHEAYRAPPAPKIKPFSGTGTMLGHPTPRLAPPQVPSTTTAEPPVSLPGPEVDDSKPVTQLQVRMPDGKRLVLRLNHSHTIADVRQAILSQRPSLAVVAFNLMTAYPSRELADDAQTLEDAKLLNSTILIRLTSNG